MGISTKLTALSLKLKIIIICSVTVLVGGIAALIILTAGREETYRVLKVFELTGSAVISREGTGELDAYVGMNLESGDTLSVDEGSTLRISMDNDKYLLLDSGTVLELVAEGTSADSKTSVKLIQGTILNELTEPLSANSSYEVHTPKATMAVRGTSFMVSVELAEDGSYLIRTNTFHGKVEAILLDADGNPTGERALVPEDKCIIIRTVPDTKTGNPAEIDGRSFFVYEIEPGVFVEVPEGSDPVSDIVYEYISKVIKEYALRSNDSGIMVLDEFITKKLRGSFADTGSKTKQTEANAVQQSEPAETEVTTVPTTVTTDETTVTTVPTTVTTAETTVTTVPTTVTTAETTVTTVPTTVTTAETTVTTVPTTATAAETTVTTAPTTVTSAETTVTSVPVTESYSEIIVTTVPVTEFIIDTSVLTTVITAETTVPTSGSETETTTVTEEPEVFSVTFSADGRIIATRTVESGSTVTDIPDVPAKTGYTGKWVYDGREFTSSTAVTSDITVEAEYTIKTYTVTFTAEGSSDITMNVDYGGTVKEIPDVPEKTGHTGKWVYNGSEFTSSAVITTNITVTAEYTVNTYTVTFTAEGSSDITMNVDYGGTVKEIPDVPENPGYTGEWIYDDSEFTSEVIITSDIVVEARYTQEEYTVTYVLSSDTSVVLYELTGLHYGDVPSSIELSAALDYDNDGSYDYYLLNWTQPTTAITGDTTIEVPYVDYDSVVEVKITDAGGTVSHELYQLGDSVTLPTTAATLEGYEFVGWGAVTSGGYSEIKEGAASYTDSSDNYFTYGTPSYDPGGTASLTSDISLNNSPNNFKFVAVYSPVQYTVNFCNEDGTILSSIEASYDDYLYRYTIPDIPAIDGKTGKWIYMNDDGNETDVTDGYVKVTSDMNIYLVYEET